MLDIQLLRAIMKGKNESNHISFINQEREKMERIDIFTAMTFSSQTRKNANKQTLRIRCISRLSTTLMSLQAKSI